ncbi:leukocidin/Hemolysin toxin family protein (plasmid) [Bacillus cereus]|uniref:leukocidin family pore-forming toxin n=2 Tax=Bacillus TaxID=1386 RepID=UPI000540FECD|nr:leukocidin/Hemolysin toxin family protein [Bacillus cereus]AJI08049.1 leukocidin/Hemolysin toxin family protein [Bacillus cereus G9241]QPS53551.1 leukocidin family pore-forming toxin [Bacillus tropicus]
MLVFLMLQQLDNFIPKDQLPSLAAYGFQLSTVIVVAEKNQDTTDLIISNTRVSDYYGLKWLSIGK